MNISNIEVRGAAIENVEDNTKTGWLCWSTLKQAGKNTAWCLLGCSIGDLGTIAAFQIFSIDWPTFYIMLLAIFNGLVTSMILEAIILTRQIGIRRALEVALGMSLISMISMEAAMNLVDIWITGGAILTFWAIPPMLLAGFVTPLPYNYWRLKKYGEACH